MKLRVLVVTMMAGGMLVGCALQEVGAPIYSRTGDISTTAPVSMTGDMYTVQPGDTLYSIATRHGCNPTELARANGISDPTLLSPGTVLRLTSARTQPVDSVAVDLAPAPSTEVTIGAESVAAQQTAGSVVLNNGTNAAATQKPLGNTMLSWPVARNQITKQFSDENSKGIEIAGNMGDDVRAAAAGRVLYTLSLIHISEPTRP